MPPKVQKTSQEGSRDKGENDDGKHDAPSLVAQKPFEAQGTNHSGSTQKQAEMGRKKVFYPGDKLNF